MISHCPNQTSGMQSKKNLLCSVIFLMAPFTLLGIEAELIRLDSDYWLTRTTTSASRYIYVITLHNIQFHWTKFTHFPPLPAITLLDTNKSFILRCISGQVFIPPQILVHYFSPLHKFTKFLHVKGRFGTIQLWWRQRNGNINEARLYGRDKSDTWETPCVMIKI